MRIQIPTFGAAVVLTLLCMGGLGLLVLWPIACIQWTWNSVMMSWRFLPLINVWQAALLYMASVALLYITGMVRIEFEPDKVE